MADQRENATELRDQEEVVVDVWLRTLLSLDPRSPRTLRLFRRRLQEMESQLQRDGRDVKVERDERGEPVIRVAAGGCGRAADGASDGASDRDNLSDGDTQEPGDFMRNLHDEGKAFLYDGPSGFHAVSNGAILNIGKQSTTVWKP